jgi:CelD/BcsL family acetyltransferase involved in cellulose biosynthesis
MPEPVHFSPLGSSDAPAISRLQRKLFPPELTEPEDYIRNILRNTEQHMLCNLSFGLFDGTSLVGYAFFYVETESIFFNREEETIYIKEVALRPGYEKWLRPLLLKIFSQWVTYCPNAAAEAHAQPDSAAKWMRLVRAFRTHGVTLAVRDEDGVEGRPPYKLVRFEMSTTSREWAEKAGALPEPAWAFRDGITVTDLTKPRQWLALKAEWPVLLRQTTDSNVFQSFDYLWQWWRYFGQWNGLRVIVIRRDESIIGVAPLMVEHFPIFGKVVRKLLFITAPMEMSRPKFLFGNEAASCFPALLAYLSAAANTWDIIDVDEQLDDDHAEALWSHFRRSGCLLAESSTTCPYIRVEGSWDDFLSSRSRKLRSNINRLRRKLAASGEVRVHTVSSWPALESALDTHCGVEERSWKAAQNLHISGDKDAYLFYRALARCFGSDERLELRLLECDGKPIASTFGILSEGVFQSLKIAHDREYDNLSPGTVLESYELEDLFSRDVSRYEFMGSFLSNKLRWTSTVYETTNVHVYQRQPRLMLFFFVFFVLKRKVKSVLKRIGQFDRVDRFLSRFRSNPFARY